jgi:hypothetical protein
MAQGIFVAEVIDDELGYGGKAQRAVQSLSSLFSGTPEPPVGTVEWRAAGDPTLPPVSGFAAPLLPHQTSIPLKGEHILVMAAFSGDATTATTTQAFYYLGPIQLANNKNQNKSPNVFKRGTGGLPAIPNIPFITEKKQFPIQPLVGDVIIQDRFGSALRFSSTPSQLSIGKLTAPSTAGTFPWKASGIPLPKVPSSTYPPQGAGNPIITLTCGLALPAGAVGSATSKTLTENTEADKSLIYLTTDQRIDITTATFGLAGKYKKEVKIPMNGVGTDKLLGVASPDTDEGGPPKAPGFIGKTTPTPAPVEVIPSKIVNSHASVKKGGLFSPPRTYPQAGSNVSPTSQIIIKSDRLLLVSYSDSIILNSRKDIKFITNRWQIDGDAFFSNTEAMMVEMKALATHMLQFEQLMATMLRVLVETQFATAVGPTSACLQPYFEAFERIRQNIEGGGEFQTDAAKQKPSIIALTEARISDLKLMLDEFSVMKQSKETRI